MPKLNGFDLQTAARGSPPAHMNPKLGASKWFGGGRRHMASKLPTKTQMLTVMAKEGVPVRTMAELAKI